MKSTPTRLLLLFFAALLATSLLAAEPTPDELQSQLRYARKKFLDLKKAHASEQLVAEQQTKIVELEKQLGVDSKIEARGDAAGDRGLRQLINIDFPGGTIADFLNTMAKVPRVSFNIIAEDQNTLNVQLPPFSLRNADARTLLQVLMRLLTSRGYELAPVGMEDNSVSGVLMRQEAPKPARLPPTMFDSFPLGSYLADQSIDDIVTAIRTGWELDPAHDKDSLRLKFHPGTAILLVSGPPEAIQVAAKVVSQLKGLHDKDSKSNLRKLATPEPDKR